MRANSLAGKWRYKFSGKLCDALDDCYKLWDDRSMCFSVLSTPLMCESNARAQHHFMYTSYKNCTYALTHSRHCLAARTRWYDSLTPSLTFADSKAKVPQLLSAGVTLQPRSPRQSETQLSLPKTTIIKIQWTNIEISLSECLIKKLKLI